MPEATISLEGHAEELAVFGSRDQHLRQIRDALGVKVLARHGEVRVEGEGRPGRAGPADLRELCGRSTGAGGTSCGRRGRPDRSDAAPAGEAPSGGDAGDPRGQPGGPAAVGGAGALPQGAASTTLWSSASGRRAPARPTWPWRWRSRRCGRGESRRSSWSGPRSRRASIWDFLPGDLEAKINPYLRPLLDALHDLMDYDQIRRYMDNDLIEIAPLAYMRGRTLNDAMIILDEGQNATVPQMKMFLTRMGQNARIVVTGDITQVDLPVATDERPGRRRGPAGEGSRRGDRVPRPSRTSSGTLWCRRSSTLMKRRNRVAIGTCGRIDRTRRPSRTRVPRPDSAASG